MCAISWRCFTNVAVRQLQSGNFVHRLISNSKEQASTLIRKFISPSLRFKLREIFNWLKELGSRACFWRWEIVQFPLGCDSPYSILYVGRKTHKDLAKALLTIEGNAEKLPAKSKISSSTAFVSEIPFPGALRVPGSLCVVVPLGRPIENITAGFGDNLRRLHRKHLKNYRMRQTLNDTEIDQANREMLQPYASARHGAAAAQIAPDEVRRLALKAGRLDFVLVGDEVVACNLGCEFAVAGKKYWSTIRFGYPRAVFSDPKRLSETNAVCFYLALEWAVKNGYDYYDMGACLGRPEDELLQWKKRWGGLVNTMGNYAYFHVRLPQTGAAEFLWNAPLFSAEGNNLTLHLGFPDGHSDEQILNRYRKMRFSGLFKIYLHCAKQPSEFLLDKLRGLYTRQQSQPIVELVESRTDNKISGLRCSDRDKSEHISTGPH